MSVFTYPTVFGRVFFEHGDGHGNDEALPVEFAPVFLLVALAMVAVAPDPAAPGGSCSGATVVAPAAAVALDQAADALDPAWTVEVNLAMCIRCSAVLFEVAPALLSVA